jgi:hypothetical protein
MPKKNMERLGPDLIEFRILMPEEGSRIAHRIFVLLLNFRLKYSILKFRWHSMLVIHYRPSFTAHFKPLFLVRQIYVFNSTSFSAEPTWHATAFINWANIAAEPTKIKVTQSLIETGFWITCLQNGEIFNDKSAEAGRFILQMHSLRCP